MYPESRPTAWIEKPTGFRLAPLPRPELRSRWAPTERFRSAEMLGRVGRTNLTQLASLCMLLQVLSFSALRRERTIVSQLDQSVERYAFGLVSVEAAGRTRTPQRVIPYQRR